MDISAKKTNYFYIDESGNINNNSKTFIHGCIKTDSPQVISETLVELKKEMASDIYYGKFRDKILKDGFHATADTPDMRKELYRLLPLLNYRAYIVIVNKETEFFKNKFATGDESDFFTYTLHKLLDDRLSAHKEDRNIFYFENILLKKKSLKRILEDYFSALDNTYDYEYHIVGKEEENLAIVDYVNYLFNHLFEKDKPMEQIADNFDMVGPKIAIVKILHKNIFLSRKNDSNLTVTLNNLRANF